MARFEKCHKCKPPERYPGCHDHCKYYKEARAAYDERKAAEDQQRKASASVYGQKDYAVSKALKKNRHRQFGGGR